MDVPENGSIFQSKNRPIVSHGHTGRCERTTAAFAAIKKNELLATLCID